MEKAYELAARWNRVFLRSVRALRDLRRYGPLVIRNAPGGQVNIGEKQVNVQGNGQQAS